MRGLRTAGALAALLLALAVAGPAQEISVSLAAGGFFASKPAYREIYGQGTVLAGDVWLKLRGPIGFAAGFGRVADSGLAVPLSGGDEAYPLDIRRTTVPLLVFYEAALAGIDVRIGAGVGIHSYKEVWPTEGISFEGDKVSARWALTASIPLLDRLSLLVLASYESISTGAGSPLDANVNLGGFQLLGGLSFRLFR